MQRIAQVLRSVWQWLPNKYDSWRLANSKQTVPVISISSRLDSNQTERIRRQLKMMKAFRNAPAIALLVDTSEGSAAQAHIIIQMLKGEAKKRNVPLITFGQDLCIATGFLLLSAGDKVFIDAITQVYADNTSLIGTTTFGANKINANSEWLEKVVYASPGQHFLEPSINSFENISQDKRQQIIEISGEIQKEIEAQIKSYRGDRLKDPQFELMSSEQALTTGLIDGIGTFTETLEREYPGSKVHYMLEPNQTFLGRLKQMREKKGAYSVPEI